MTDTPLDTNGGGEQAYPIPVSEPGVWQQRPNTQQQQGTEGTDVVRQRHMAMLQSTVAQCQVIDQSHVKRHGHRSTDVNGQTDNGHVEWRPKRRCSSPRSRARVRLVTERLPFFARLRSRPRSRLRHCRCPAHSSGTAGSCAPVETATPPTTPPCPGWRTAGSCPMPRHWSAPGDIG